MFTSWGKETAKQFAMDELRKMVSALDNSHRFGTVLRAKGIVAGKDGNWLHFDYVPGETDVREGCADVIGRLCVIGEDIHEEALLELFGIEG